MLVEGINSVVVRATLRKDIPDAFELVKRYIVENRLMVRAGRGGDYFQSTGAFPVFNTERRDPDSNNW